ncbi:MAG: hypothetical protein ACK54C_11935 [Betaproteobacteria bacterium]
MKIEQWLEHECPAYRSLSAEQRRLLLDEAIASEKRYRRSVARQMWWVAGGMIVLSAVLLLAFGSGPIVDPISLLVMFFVFTGGYRWRVASRVELRVRDLASTRAKQLVESRGSF